MERKISVPDMHCNGCVSRIEKALKAEKLDFSVSLEDKTVTVNGCENCIKTAVDTLADLGFTPSAL